MATTIINFHRLTVEAALSHDPELIVHFFVPFDTFRGSTCTSCNCYQKPIVRVPAALNTLNRSSLM
jgi:hypothetical protein